MASTESSHHEDTEKNANPFLIPQPITLAWSDLIYQITGKTILDGVSGQLASGQLLAVMGPSGMFTSLIDETLCG
jgi:ABC-type transporter Mla maintaining outer membrane lipid asymmetry ATPase subunit MlaF